MNVSEGNRIKKGPNTYLILGIIFLALLLATKHLTNVTISAFFDGFITGISGSFILLGLIYGISNRMKGK